VKPVTYDRRFFLLKMLQLNYSMYREKKEVKYRIALSGYYSNDKRKRIKMGMSQKEVARAAGISLSTYQRLERGKNVRCDTLVRVMEVLKIPY